MGSIRVAIAGVGNCAASLVQGVQYYSGANAADTVPGLMHVQFGDYHVSDIEFVAAFDVDAKKVGLDLADAIGASENNTIKICDVPSTGVTVQRGPTLDGLGKYYLETIDESDAGFASGRPYICARIFIGALHDGGERITQYAVYPEERAIREPA